MSILSKEEAKKILDRALSLSKADHVELSLSGSKGGNIRFARNNVSTAGEESTISLSISSSFGTKTGATSINEFDDASLERAVRRSEELAGFAPEDREFMPPLEQQEYVESRNFVQSTADINADYRAKVAKANLLPAREEGVIAAGFLQDGENFVARANSAGLFAYDRRTNMDFTITMRTEDGTGSGWASRDFNDANLFDPEEAARVAIDKAVASREAKAIEPGNYTVVLEPAAAIGLIGPMVRSMGARQADEGRSFLSKRGGGNRLGDKIVDSRVKIYSDPQHPIVPSNIFDGSGQAIKPMTWVENGEVKNMFYSRFWAKEKGVDPIPFPGSFVMEGGSATTEELIKSTKRGILVTRLWYIRSVDPQTLLYTGLTRDGTFYIEDGEIKYPVKNFRFNESPIIMLNNLEELGQPQRINGNMVPAMKIRDFTFTSLSDAV
ncbi:MAG: TldD/PmbA family protein [Cyclobacteriaceae bacterium]|nr:TldD/PmbA family protein [Cyclobacteriaceae bacterium]MCH8516242.1 TldD/PmbA family protein [Cyclobacteriaceae bacterium]